MARCGEPCGCGTDSRLARDPSRRHASTGPPGPAGCRRERSRCLSQRHRPGCVGERGHRPGGDAVAHEHRPVGLSEQERQQFGGTHLAPPSVRPGGRASSPDEQRRRPHRSECGACVRQGRLQQGVGGLGGCAGRRDQSWPAPTRPALLARGWGRGAAVDHQAAVRARSAPVGPRDRVRRPVRGRPRGDLARQPGSGPSWRRRRHRAEPAPSIWSEAPAQTHVPNAE